MNKNLLGLVVATFVTIAAPAASAPVATSSFHTQMPPTFLYDLREMPQTNFPEAAAINAKSEMYSANPRLLEFKDRQLKMDEAQAVFERQIQTGFFAAAGAATTILVGCLFAEWLQEFKVRKAEKAKLIAEIKCRTLQIKAACR